MSRYGVILLTGALWPATAPASAGTTCDKPCDDDLVCMIEVAKCLINAKHTTEAIALLKGLRERQTGDPLLAQLLASAYLMDGNPFWAERTLLEVLEKHPDDCETRSWLVWVYFKNGELALAAEKLKEPGCPKTEVEKTRFDLLALIITRATADVEMEKPHWEAVSHTKAAYLEDKALWEHLLLEKNPGWIAPLQLSVEASGGYTSNGRAGSPTDATAKGDSSAIGRFEVDAHFVAPVSKSVRPSLFGAVSGQGLSSAEARELSYLDVNIRPGILFGEQLPRLLVAYKGNLLRVNLDDKTWYYESHRAELEFETERHLFLFSGAGRRIFAENGRTRTELDTGLGGTVSVGNRFQLVMALSGRRHFAVGEPYDLEGVTGLVVGRVTLGPGILIRAGVTPMVDYYLHSGGDRGLIAFGTEEKRLDFLIKQFEEIWSPPFHRLRFGLRYAFSYRRSTADSAVGSYDYTEHRLLAGLRWAVEMNPFGPRTVSSGEHAPLDFGLDSKEELALEEERIQDLLRQDEAARSGSSCVN